MGPPNRVILPDNIDKDLGDLRRRILAVETAGGSPQPYTYTESVDNAHPMDIDFPLPSGGQSASAKLSFKFKPYRTTSSSAGGNTGAGSSHAHGSVAHSHSHAHNLKAATGTGDIAVGWFSVASPYGLTGPGLTGTNNTDVTAIQTDATNTTPGSTGSEASHTHSVGGSSLGVAEGTATTISALAIDGVDKTSTLGGPWLVDTVDLDLTAVLPLGDGHWHKLTLTPAGQGRIVAILRLA